MAEHTTRNCRHARASGHNSGL